MAVRGIATPQLRLASILARANMPTLSEGLLFREILTLQVVKGNTVETRRVRVGLTSDTSTEILEGLDVGETVVADAGTSLHDGDQIKTMFADELERTRTR